MILSDFSIKSALADGSLSIEPFDEKQLQPSSYDVRLGAQFILFKTPEEVSSNLHTPIVLDPYKENMLTKKVTLDDYSYIELAPNDFILGATKEIIGVGEALVGRIEGKSSLGRLGILVHATAGYVDPGWLGRLTLEIKNIAPYPVKIYENMLIAQVAFDVLSTPAHRKYGDKSLGSKYQGDMGPNVSKTHTMVNHPVGT